MIDSFSAYQLSDICTRLSSGKSIHSSKVSEAGPYPVIGGNGYRGFTQEPNFVGECAVIGRQGAACGNVRFFSGKAYMTEHAVVAQTNPSHNTRYLAYLLSTMELGRLSAQSAQPGLSVKTLGKQEVSLPSKETQDRIVALLGALDDAIESNAKLNDYLAEMLDARYGRLIAESNESALLVDIVRILSGGTPKTKNSEYWEDGRIPFFAPGDVTNSVYTLVTEKHITELGLDNCNSALYPVDTVFLTARGTVGKVAMAGRPMAMNQSCFAFAGINAPQTVVFQVIKGAVRSLKAKANGATFAAINTRDLKDEEVPVLSTENMAIYDEWAKPVHAMIRSNEEESLRLAELRDALLPKLMSGEIDVSKVDLTPLNNHLVAMLVGCLWLSHITE